VTRFPRKPVRWLVVVGGGTPYLPQVTEDVPLDLIETRTFGAAVIDSIVWVSSPDCPDFYDAELRAHHEHLRAAYGISPGNEVLDIGCGAGLTTREAARAAEPGRVVGVDISERMLERARQATAAERIGNVVYQVGDAQTHQFAPGAFDVVISRFGTMFFADPAAAFANIATAMRPSARLVLLVCQRSEENEWAQAIDGALGEAAGMGRTRVS
jgi:SAM-dependent methyltransferase